MPLEEALLERISGVSPIALLSDASAATIAVVAATGQLRQTESAAMRAGTQLHLALQMISDARDARAPPPDAAVLAARLGIDPGAAQTLHDAAHAVCVAPALSHFFDPAQFVRARNEMTYANAQGEVRRVDRVVECASEVWVLDYKSQVSDAERTVYAAQVTEYVNALRCLYPHKIMRGALIDMRTRTLLVL